MSTRKINAFQVSGTANDGDFVVGFRNTSAGGERRWTISALRQSMLGQTTLSPFQIQVAATVDRKDGSRYSPGLWYNVRSVTNDSTTRKTINFTTPLPNTNYSVQANPVGAGTNRPLHYECRPVNKATDRVTVYHVNNANLNIEPAFDLVIWA